MRILIATYGLDVDVDMNLDIDMDMGLWSWTCTGCGPKGCQLQVGARRAPRLLVVLQVVSCHPNCCVGCSLLRL